MDYNFGMTNKHISCQILSKIKFQLAFLLGADNWDDFYSQYIVHASSVNDVFQSLLQINEVDGDQSAEDIKEFVYLWQQIEDKEYCIEILGKIF